MKVSWCISAGPRTYWLIASGTEIRIRGNVKVIKALGESHLDACMVDGVAAAETYRQLQSEHLRTGELCADQHMSCERHALALISQIAQSVADCQSPSVMEAEADLMQRISVSLARSVAEAVERRRNLHCTPVCLWDRSLQAEVGLDTDDARDA